MTGATLRSALTFFVDDIEAACDVFAAEAESLVSRPNDEIDDLIDEILEDAEESTKDGFIVVERESIEALRTASYDASGDLHDARESFSWKFRKALRELKEALVRETVS